MTLLPIPPRAPLLLFRSCFIPPIPETDIIPMLYVHMYLYKCDFFACNYALIKMWPTWRQRNFCTPYTSAWGAVLRPTSCHSAPFLCHHAPSSPRCVVVITTNTSTSNGIHASASSNRLFVRCAHASHSCTWVCLFVSIYLWAYESK